MDRTRNRKQRREEEKAAKGSSDLLNGKFTIALHTKPETVSPSCLGLLLTTMERAFSAGEKLPGVSFPIHIMIEFDGQKACGTVQPATAAGAEMSVDPITH